ncbi:unnamed protein product [Symbiodinium pilosum]|uniref:Uncharacterized protein n=1 Tax=Symbiodinium pilosum TaxID=2952 RepID=A0A812JXJ1_SYMPI|nr:unnamed protein product [Symbiodinium pilosum]
MQQKLPFESLSRVPRAQKPEPTDVDPESPASPLSPLYSPWQSFSVEQFKASKGASIRKLQEGEVQAILDNWDSSLSRISRKSFQSVTFPEECERTDLPPNRLIHEVHNAHMCRLSKEISEDPRKLEEEIEYRRKYDFEPESRATRQA